MTKYITKEELLAIFRKHKPADFVKESEYDSPESECPMCGEATNNKGSMICTDKCVFESIKSYFESNPEKKQGREKEIAKIYAIENNLTHGETIKFFGDGYRNEGLYFWDANKKEIVLPFTEIDDYGSVPPRFVVGNGTFPPNRWLDEVTNNSYVFPSIELIDKIKDAVRDSPNNNSNKTVTIDGITYTYNKNQIEKHNGWDSIILEVDSPDTVTIHPGKPEWRDKYINIEPKQRKRKTNVMHELKEQLNMAPPMPGISEGGPGYQTARDNFKERIRIEREGRKGGKKRKTRKFGKKLNKTKKVHVPLFKKYK